MLLAPFGLGLILILKRFWLILKLKFERIFAILEKIPRVSFWKNSWGRIFLPQE